MAEIEIEKKKPVWPWILLILVILAILYFVFFNDDDTVNDVTDEVTTEMDTTVWEDNAEETNNWNNEELMNDTLAYTGAGVSGFVTYIGDESRMGVDHTYTSNALLYLIDAVREKAQEANVNVTMEMDQIREKAKEITENPEATDHAGTIKEVGTEIVGVLENIQMEKFPDLSQEVTTVRNAVEKIDPSVPTLEQKDAVNSFFNEAADLLQNME